MRPRETKHSPIEQLARTLTEWTGSSAAFFGALSIVVVWGATGWMFHYDDTWQLVINTGTTIVTFLMVFLIQRSQNKDSLALHLKLNELIAATQGASDRLVNVEDLSEDELRVLHRRFQRLARVAREDGDIFEASSVEKAAEETAR